MFKPVKSTELSKPSETTAGENSFVIETTEVSDTEKTSEACEQVNERSSESTGDGYSAHRTSFWEKLRLATARVAYKFCGLPRAARYIIISVTVLVISAVVGAVVDLFGRTPDETITVTKPAETEYAEATSVLSADDLFEMLSADDEPADNGILRYLETDRTALFNNENAVGWLQIPGTLVDYAVVQADDNAYFLNKSADGADSEEGAIYGDYRNNFNQLDRNNVIYGHNMASGSMFGTLRRMLSDDYFKENEGYMYFNSRYYNNIFKVYSVYEIDLTTFCYIQTGFADDGEFSDFVQRTRELNSVKALDGADVPPDTYLLTLSTCIEGGTKRLVVHGFLYSRDMG